MRYALLSLLAHEPAHGYDLKAELESGFGGIWEAVNGGQVYSTLQRLDRDGLVTSEPAPDADGRNKRVYAITNDGRDILQKWLEAGDNTPVVSGELFRKVLIARRTGLTDPIALIDDQRTDALNRLGAIQRVSPSDDENGLLRRWVAVRLQADLIWLDECDTWLRSNNPRGTRND